MTGEPLFFVYMLECVDGSFYTGFTRDLEKRLDKHNKGLASKYTRARLPVRMVYSECLESKSAALKREYTIKQLTRPQKAALLQK